MKVPLFYPQGQCDFKPLQQPEHDTQPYLQYLIYSSVVSDYKRVVQPQTVWTLVDEFMFQEPFRALLSAGTSLDCLSYVFHIGDSQDLWEHHNPHNLLWDHLKIQVKLLFPGTDMDTHFVVAVLLVFLRPRLYGGGRQGRLPPVNSNKVNSIKGQQAKFRILFKGIWGARRRSLCPDLCP